MLSFRLHLYGEDMGVDATLLSVGAGQEEEMMMLSEISVVEL